MGFMTEYVLKECYKNNYSIEFVSKNFGIEPSIVQGFYSRFDSEKIVDNYRFCERNNDTNWGISQI